MEQFSELVGMIYDAAVDAELWPVALQMMAQFVGADWGVLVSEDAIAERSFVHYQSRPMRKALEAYYATYVHTNPILVPTLIDARVGSVFTVTSFMPRTAFLASRFYQEWAGPNGFVDTIGTVLDKSSRNFTILSLLRNHEQGWADDDAITRAQLVAPHACRAHAIGRQIDLSRFQASSVADTLDGLTTAVILLDGHLRIRLMNKAAESLLRQNDPLRVTGLCLGATSADALGALQKAVDACALRDRVGSAVMSVALRTSKGDHFIAHALPLTDGERRRAGADYSAVAALFIKPVQRSETPPLDALAALYGLTSRELTVLLGIAEHGGIPDVATMLGISPGTVKAHLKRVFAKTGARRQADLAKIVAGVANPLAMPPR